MIKHLDVDGFKNLSMVSLDLKPLTIVTGRNSTGKSSLIHSILLSQPWTNVSPFYGELLNLEFSAVRNKYTNGKTIKVGFECEGGDNSSFIWEDDNQITCNYPDSLPILEKSMYYLSANRIGTENTAASFPDFLISGPMGAALFSTLEREKSQPVEPELVIYPESQTLSSQISYWLSYIMDIPLEISVERRSTMEVEVRYKSDGISDMLPSQLGAGVSYLAKILILCLRSKRNDIIMIENPEIHLYPLAQSRLAEFLSFIAASGRQLIIETHSNEIITKVRHEVYKDNLTPEDIVVLYKDSINSDFIRLGIDNNGHFTEKFPTSFFDATLEELREMD